MKSPQRLLCWLLLLCSPLWVASISILESSTLINLNGTTGGTFGWSVAISGSTIVAGSYVENSLQGAAYLFDCSTSFDPCALAAKLEASDGVPNDQFGYSVAISDGLIAIGAKNHDGNKLDQGAIYVFDCTTSLSSCIEVAKLESFDGEEGDELGTFISIDGAIIVAGTPAHNNSKGAAYAFDCTFSFSSCFTIKFESSDGVDGDKFGLSVDISGSKIVASAPFHHSNGFFDSGAVYVFECTPSLSSCNETKLEAPDAGNSDNFGGSVAIDGSIVIVGAPFHNLNGTNDRGAAYAFQCEPFFPHCPVAAKLNASDGEELDNFGWAVGISGTNIVVSASADDSNQGSVYAFDCSSSLSSCVEARLVASDGERDDSLGSSVSISNSSVVAGAVGYDVNTNINQGAVYVFGNALPLVSVEVTMTIPMRQHSGSVGDISLSLIGSLGRSASVSLGSGFARGQVVTLTGLLLNAVGELYGVELINSSPSDGLRIGTLDLLYMGSIYSFGLNEIVKPIKEFNGNLFSF